MQDNVNKKKNKNKKIFDLITKLKALLINVEEFIFIIRKNVI